MENNQPPRVGLFDDRVENLQRGGLCDGDRREILAMTLEDIADEFRLPEWLLIRAIETLCMTSCVGRMKEKEDRTRDCPE